MRRHVYYYTHVGGSYDALARLLGGDPAAWLPLPALPHGDRWLVDLHADGPLPPAVSAHRAALEVGTTSAGPASLLRGVTWRSVSAEGVIPVLVADLELSALSSTVCQLSLLGSYRPPLSVVGSVADRVVGHRVAEACVRRFVHDVTERLAVATLPA